MFADVKIIGLAEAESAAKAILEHVDAIRKLQTACSYPGIKITVDIKNEADSSN